MRIIFQVCQYDKVIVDVQNRMKGSSVSIHWHGLFQRKTPWMDGVPGVTNCPILEKETFRYSFCASEYGTLFGHSHDGNITFFKRGLIEGTVTAMFL
jgi:Putative multicopper oxidases